MRQAEGHNGSHTVREGHAALPDVPQDGSRDAGSELQEDADCPPVDGVRMGLREVTGVLLVVQALPVPNLPGPMSASFTVPRMTGIPR